MFKINAFNDWCRLICLVSITSGVLMSLLPKSKLDNAFKGLVCLIFIFCIFMPLSDKKRSISYEDFIHSLENESSMDLDSTYAVVSCAENLLKHELDSEITKINPDAHCEVYITYSAENAYIERIEVFGCDNETDKENIAKFIRERAGGDIIIEYR